MTRTLWIGLAALTLTLACGDSGDPGDTVVTDTTAGPASAPSTDDPTTTTPTTGDTDDTGGDSMSADTTATTPTTTDDPPPQCTDNGQCPAPTNPCELPACLDGVCGSTFVEADTPLPDDPGNCVKLQCDGNGVAVEVNDDADVPADAPDDCLAPGCQDGAVAMLPGDADTPDDEPDDCQMPACQDGAVKLVPADDPPPDTAGDCKLTSCDAGEIVYVADDLDLPDDTIECTQDTCDSGTPAFPPKPVNSFCGDDGTFFCHSDATCQPCQEVDADCTDTSNTEPNNSQLTAYNLGSISDADSSGGYICPILKGGADVDWFHYSGNDVFLNVVDPSRTVTAELNARLCVYLDCDSGTTSVGCDADDVDDVAPGGQEGCCGVGSVSPNLNCSGIDDSAHVWIKVENVDMQMCVPYQLDYHF
jgi:hypothetical protein